MMKIGFVYDAVYPYLKGGGERRIYEVARRLHARGHEVHILGMKYWEGSDSIQNDGLIYRSLGRHVPLYHPSGRRSIREALQFGLQALRLLALEHFDVIDCGQWPYFHLLPARAYCWLRSCPMIVSWYEVWGRHWFDYLGSLGFAGAMIEKAFCHLPDQIFAVSEATRTDLISLGASSNLVQMIPNGIDYRRIRSIPQPRQKYHLSYIGRLKNHKNVDVLVETVALVKTTIPDIAAVIIGDGPERGMLLEKARSLGVSENINFTGAIEDFDDAIRLLKSSLVFVNPSTKEGGGSITLFEANACGLPVVAVRCPHGIDISLIHEGENGYFVDNLSAQEIAHKLIGLLRRPDLLKENALRSTEMAAPYDWEVVTTQHEQVYERMCHLN
jgi:glycosyltransferase involved in cell wall biosynthesis